ncbi:MAG: hypothetical protein J4F43_11250 [Dehalococcoidia bacterium]|nr:hypothetical protein [Dehalococcoidia bacterium]
MPEESIRSVKRIKELFHREDRNNVNYYLADGWVLLKVLTHCDLYGTEQPVYVLGWTGKEDPPDVRKRANEALAASWGASNDG